MFFVATNLTGLYAGPSFGAEMVTQITNAMPLEIIAEKEHWRRVRQTDGYEGWAYAAYLTADPAPQATHLVSALSAPLQAQPRRDTEVVTRLVIGTGINVARTQGDWGYIKPAGEMLRAGWAHLSHSRRMDSLPLDAASARQQIVVDARTLTGVPYLWGGTTAFGIDCSGLCQLVYRLSGYAIPRDARLQFPVGTPAVEPFEPGDLLFFHSDSGPERITHVGISIGGWQMIHASRARNGVYEEDARQNAGLRQSFAGACRFLSRAGERCVPHDPIL